MFLDAYAESLVDFVVKGQDGRLPAAGVHFEVRVALQPIDWN